MKPKRIIAFVLILALLVTSFVVAAVASEDETTITITVDKAELAAGKTATVSVEVITNYPVATMSIPVFYDKTLVEISDTAATLTEYSVVNITTDNQSVDSDKVFANTGLNENQFGFVLATYIGEAGQQLKSSLNAVVFTFEVTAKEDVLGDAVIKVVETSAKTENNIEGMLYFGKSGTTLNKIPENVTDIDVTEATKNISIVAVENSVSSKTDANVEAFFDTNYANNDYVGFVYGIDTLANVTKDGPLMDNLTTQYGDEYLEIDGDETTGTIINVKDKEGNVVESYIFIYFGDVDMDGEISANDAFFAEYFEVYGEGITELYQLIASDVDMDGGVSANDAFFMEYFEVYGEGLLSQQEIAEKVSSNYYKF